MNKKLHNLNKLNVRLSNINGYKKLYYFKISKNLKSYVAPLLCPIAAILLFSGITVFSSVYVQAVEVDIKDKSLALSASEIEVKAAIQDVEQQVSEIIGEEYTLEIPVKIEAKLATKEDVASIQDLQSTIMNEIDAVSQSYVIKVDGDIVAANENQTALNNILNDLKESYLSESTVKSDFVQDVSISYDYIPTNMLQDLSSIQSKLSKNIKEAMSYNVQKGDTYSEIAQTFGMKLSELMSLNPQASIERLMIGDVLNIKKEVPFLSVKTVEEVSYKEEIESPIEYKEDPNLYIGDTKILSKGTPGESEVQASVTLINGLEQEREIIKTNVVTTPTVTIIAKGTTPRPKTASFGTYIWPVRGTVSSAVGNRFLFGSSDYHSGLDIAAPYGTTVKASDGGKVTFSGWNGDYGNLVIITHDDGTQTYYAHNSSLLVSKGDRVYQGQSIAKVGATGRTTGNHSHFEVRVGGAVKNPYNYLS
ncbi:M23 family metallopeptidase [Anaerotignum sp.]|uniref:M23 family metallopeptidase n=1 Tax=Anaerotignum sp. TaxID=2039241 RepID=UPI0028985B9B|nr:M23 family metallopeptidase [Anaerotignum sp.]